jgi:3-phenylpropionate/trans-cinnamate dioxygenase ferredoxin reductase subunit
MFFDTRPKVSVEIAQTGETYVCAINENLLKGMLKLGRKGIPAGCVSGGCGVCKVRILSGQVQSCGPVSRAHISVEDEAQGITLACRVTPVTAVRLEVAGRLIKPFSKERASLASSESS